MIDRQTYYRIRRTEHRAGQRAAFDHVLHYLNTLDEQRPDKGELYKAIIEMRPQ